MLLELLQPQEYLPRRVNTRLTWNTDSTAPSTQKSQGRATICGCLTLAKGLFLITNYGNFISTGLSLI